MKPTVCRTVHFITDTQSPRTYAAIITGIVDPEHVGADDVVDLHIMPPGGAAYDLTSVPFSATPLSGHWTWPPRV